MTLNNAIRKAIHYQQSGQLRKAEEVYRRILTVDPDHSTALHLLGVMARQKGNYDSAVVLTNAAIRSHPETAEYYTSLGWIFADQGQLKKAAACYQQSLQLKPDFVEACFRLANVYHEQKNFKDAIIYYLKAVNLKPDFVEASYNAGLAYQLLGNFREAVAWYRRALKLNPNFVEAFNNLGQVLQQAGKSEEAQACFREAIRIKPDFAEAYFNLADLQCRRGQKDEAEKNFTRALRINPHMIEALNNLGNLYKDRGNIEAALKKYRQVIRLNPQLAEAYYNLGSALRLQGGFSEAIENFKCALQLKPDYAEAYNNLGLTYKNMGELEAAICNFTCALDIKQGFGEAHWNRSFTFLLQGNFAEGWNDYEWRYKQPRWKTIYPFRLNVPRWNGSSARDKRIFVHDEQGLGDTLQFVRYLPLLKSLCGTLILETRKALMELLNGFPGIDELVERSTDGNPAVAFDYYLPLLSLPGIFNTTPENIPGKVPYLYADPDKIAYWRDRLETKNFKVGLVWAGRPLHANDHNRSCNLDQFASLATIAGVRLYGLQKGPAADQSAHWSACPDFENLGQEFEDFSDTAAAIACLDLVISVDTSVAHLAGAMAKPVWVLLPFIPDWRWMMDRTDSPWYPTMKLFRQNKHGDWGSVFQRVKEELQRIVKVSK